MFSSKSEKVFALLVFALVLSGFAVAEDPFSEVQQERQLSEPSIDYRYTDTVKEEIVEHESFTVGEDSIEGIREEEDGFVVEYEDRGNVTASEHFVEDDEVVSVEESGYIFSSIDELVVESVRTEPTYYIDVDDVRVTGYDHGSVSAEISVSRNELTEKILDEDTTVSGVRQGYRFEGEVDEQVIGEWRSSLSGRPFHSVQGDVEFDTGLRLDEQEEQVLNAEMSLEEGGAVARIGSSSVEVVVETEEEWFDGFEDGEEGDWFRRPRDTGDDDIDGEECRYDEDTYDCEWGVVSEDDVDDSQYIISGDYSMHSYVDNNGQYILSPSMTQETGNTMQGVEFDIILDAHGGEDDSGDFTEFGVFIEDDNNPDYEYEDDQVIGEVEFQTLTDDGEEREIQWQYGDTEGGDSGEAVLKDNWEVDEVYNIEMYIDREEDKADVVINDEVFNDLPINPEVESDIDRIGFRERAWGGDGSERNVYWDDVTFYSEQTPIDLLSPEEGAEMPTGGIPHEWEVECGDFGCEGAGLFVAPVDVTEDEQVSDTNDEWESNAESLTNVVAEDDELVLEETFETFEQTDLTYPEASDNPGGGQSPREELYHVTVDMMDGFEGDLELTGLDGEFREDGEVRIYDESEEILYSEDKSGGQESVTLEDVELEENDIYYFAHTNGWYYDEDNCDRLEGEDFVDVIASSGGDGTLGEESCDTQTEDGYYGFSEYTFYWEDEVFFEEGERVEHLSLGGEYQDSEIQVDEDVPSGTGTVLEVAVTEDDSTEPDDEEYEEIESGDSVPQLESGDDLDGLHLWVRNTLESDEDTEETPALIRLESSVTTVDAVDEEFQSVREMEDVEDGENEFEYGYTDFELPGDFIWNVRVEDQYGDYWWSEENRSINVDRGRGVMHLDSPENLEMLDNDPVTFEYRVEAEEDGSVSLTVDDDTLTVDDVEAGEDYEFTHDETLTFGEEYEWELVYDGEDGTIESVTNTFELDTIVENLTVQPDPVRWEDTAEFEVYATEDRIDDATITLTRADGVVVVDEDELEETGEEDIWEYSYTMSPEEEYVGTWTAEVEADNIDGSGDTETIEFEVEENPDPDPNLEEPEDGESRINPVEFQFSPICFSEDGCENATLMVEDLTFDEDEESYESFEEWEEANILDRVSASRNLQSGELGIGYVDQTDIQNTRFAFWRLDEEDGEFEDYSGNDFDGTDEGVDRGLQGVFGTNAVNTEDGYVDVSPLPLDRDSMTVAAWVRTDDVEGDGNFGSGIMAWDEGETFSKMELAISNEEDVEPCQTEGVAQFYYGDGDDFIGVCGEEPITDGEWTFLVASFEQGDEMNLFVDGEHVDTNDAPELADDISNVAYIGESPQSGANHLGDISNMILIDDRVDNEESAAELMRKTSPEDEMFTGEWRDEVMEEAVASWDEAVVDATTHGDSDMSLVFEALDEDGEVVDTFVTDVEDGENSYSIDVDNSEGLRYGIDFESGEVEVTGEVDSYELSYSPAETGESDEVHIDDVENDTLETVEYDFEENGFDIPDQFNWNVEVEQSDGLTGKDEDRLVEVEPVPPPEVELVDPVGDEGVSPVEFQYFADCYEDRRECVEAELWYKLDDGSWELRDTETDLEEGEINTFFESFEEEDFPVDLTWNVNVIDDEGESSFADSNETVTLTEHKETRVRSVETFDSEDELESTIYEGETVELEAEVVTENSVEVAEITITDSEGEVVVDSDDMELKEEDDTSETYKYMFDTEGESFGRYDVLVEVEDDEGNSDDEAGYFDLNSFSKYFGFEWEEGSFESVSVVEDSLELEFSEDDDVDRVDSFTVSDSGNFNDVYAPEGSDWLYYGTDRGVVIVEEEENGFAEETLIGSIDDGDTWDVIYDEDRDLLFAGTTTGDIVVFENIHEGEFGAVDTYEVHDDNIFAFDMNEQNQLFTSSFDDTGKKLEFDEEDEEFEEIWEFDVADYVGAGGGDDVNVHDVHLGSDEEFVYFTTNWLDAGVIKVDDQGSDFEPVWDYGGYGETVYAIEESWFEEDRYYIVGSRNYYEKIKENEDGEPELVYQSDSVDIDDDALTDVELTERERGVVFSDIEGGLYKFVEDESGEDADSVWEYDEHADNIFGFKWRDMRVFTASWDDTSHMVDDIVEGYVSEGVYTSEVYEVLEKLEEDEVEWLEVVADVELNDQDAELVVSNSEYMSETEGFELQDGRNVYDLNLDNSSEALFELGLETGDVDVSPVVNSLELRHTGTVEEEEFESYEEDIEQDIKGGTEFEDEKSLFASLLDTASLSSLASSTVEIIDEVIVEPIVDLDTEAVETSIYEKTVGANPVATSFADSTVVVQERLDQALEAEGTAETVFELSRAAFVSPFVETETEAVEASVFDEMVSVNPVVQSVSEAGFVSEERFEQVFESDTDVEENVLLEASMQQPFDLTTDFVSSLELFELLFQRVEGDTEFDEWVDRVTIVEPENETTGFNPVEHVFIPDCPTDNDCVEADLMVLNESADGGGEDTETYTETFEYTGDVQDFEVPEGVDEITVEVYGAEGGMGRTDGDWESGEPGLGGYHEADFDVSEGEEFDVYVGGRGEDGDDSDEVAEGGFHGGGDSDDNGDGGAGGGKSEVRPAGESLEDALIVGAGGAGASTVDTGFGDTDLGDSGDGGIEQGEDGEDADTGGAFGDGGEGGTQTEGGSGGEGDDEDGNDGSFGEGADGVSPGGASGSGGAGAGWYGGGSAGGGQAGGATPEAAVGGSAGGSNFVDDGRLLEEGESQEGVETDDGHGKVVIEYEQEEGGDGEEWMDVKSTTDVENQTENVIEYDYQEIYDLPEEDVVWNIRVEFEDGSTEWALDRVMDVDGAQLYEEFVEQDVDIDDEGLRALTVLEDVLQDVDTDSVSDDVWNALSQEVESLFVLSEVEDTAVLADREELGAVVSSESDGELSVEESLDRAVLMDVERDSLLGFTSPVDQLVFTEFEVDETTVSREEVLVELDPEVDVDAARMLLVEVDQAETLVVDSETAEVFEPRFESIEFVEFQTETRSQLDVETVFEQVIGIELQSDNVLTGEEERLQEFAVVTDQDEISEVLDVAEEDVVKVTEQSEEMNVISEELKELNVDSEAATTGLFDFVGLQTGFVEGVVEDGFGSESAVEQLVRGEVTTESESAFNRVFTETLEAVTNVDASDATTQFVSQVIEVAGFDESRFEGEREFMEAVVINTEVEEAYEVDVELLEQYVLQTDMEELTDLESELLQEISVVDEAVEDIELDRAVVQTSTVDALQEDGLVGRTDVRQEAFVTDTIITEAALVREADQEVGLDTVTSTRTQLLDQQTLEVLLEEEQFEEAVMSDENAQEIIIDQEAVEKLELSEEQVQQVETGLETLSHISGISVLDQEVVLDERSDTVWDGQQRFDQEMVVVSEEEVVTQIMRQVLEDPEVVSDIETLTVLEEQGDVTVIADDISDEEVVYTGEAQQTVSVEDETETLLEIFRDLIKEFVVEVSSIALTDEQITITQDVVAEGISDSRIVLFDEVSETVVPTVESLDQSVFGERTVEVVTSETVTDEEAGLGRELVQESKVLGMTDTSIVVLDSVLVESMIASESDSALMIESEQDEAVIVQEDGLEEAGLEELVLEEPSLTVSGVDRKEFADAVAETILADTVVFDRFDRMMEVDERLVVVSDEDNVAEVRDELDENVFVDGVVAEEASLNEVADESVTVDKSADTSFDVARTVVQDVEAMMDTSRFASVDVVALQETIIEALGSLPVEEAEVLQEVNVVSDAAKIFTFDEQIDEDVVSEALQFERVEGVEEALEEVEIGAEGFEQLRSEIENIQTVELIEVTEDNFVLVQTADIAPIIETDQIENMIVDVDGQQLVVAEEEIIEGYGVSEEATSSIVTGVEEKSLFDSITNIRKLFTGVAEADEQLGVDEERVETLELVSLEEVDPTYRDEVVEDLEVLELTEDQISSESDVDVVSLSEEFVDRDIVVEEDEIQIVDTDTESDTEPWYSSVAATFVSIGLEDSSLLERIVNVTQGVEAVEVVDSGFIGEVEVVQQVESDAEGDEFRSIEVSEIQGFVMPTDMLFDPEYRVNPVVETVLDTDTDRGFEVARTLLGMVGIDTREVSEDIVVNNLTLDTPVQEGETVSISADGVHTVGRGVITDAEFVVTDPTGEEHELSAREVEEIEDNGMEGYRYETEFTATEEPGMHELEFRIEDDSGLDAVTSKRFRVMPEELIDIRRLRMNPLYIGGDTISAGIDEIRQQAIVVWLVAGTLLLAVFMIVVGKLGMTGFEENVFGQVQQK